MAKKTLIFALMVAVSIPLILSLVGWMQIKKKNEWERKKVKILTPQKVQEIRVVAVEEKVLPPAHKPVKSKKGPAKKKPTPVPNKVVSKPSKPVNLKPLKKKLEANKSLRKKAEKQGLRAKKPSPARYRLNRRMINLGRKLIDKKSSVPMVEASYEKIGFDFYLDKIRSLGGRLFVGDAIQQKILAEAMVDRRGGRYRFFGLDKDKKDDLRGLALFRPREIFGERLIEEILSNAGKLFKNKNDELRCVVLLPLDKEAAILGAFKDYLIKKTQYHISQFDKVWGYYFRSGMQLGLKVEKGRLKKGEKIIRFNLTLMM